MQDESPPASPTPAIRPSRPVLLIAIVVAAQLFSMVLNWAVSGQFLPYLSQTYGLPLESLVVLLAVVNVFSQGIAISAWWLAMLIPHSKRSIWVPLTLMVSLLLLYSALPLYRAFSNFYTWTVLGDELWRALAWWRFSSISLQLVCIGSPCYLLSRIGNLQLNQRDDLPRPTTLDINCILGLTVLIATAFAAVRWTNELESTSYAGGLSPISIVGLTTVNYVWLGIGWASLSWASATRATKWIVMTIAAYVLGNVASGYVIYWMLQSAPDTTQLLMTPPKLLVAFTYSLISSLGILASICVAHYCGYRLVFSRFVGS